MPRPRDLVERERLGLHSLVVDQLNAQRRCIARYGAVAEATTLLSCCGSGKDFLHDVVDRKPFSHGRYMPGSELRIRPLDKPLADQPVHPLLRTWNFAEEILEQQAEDRAGGGRSRASHDGKLGSDAPPGTAIHQECRQMTSSSSPYVCPSCGGRAACPFYEVDSVPVHQVKLVRTRAAALDCPRQEAAKPDAGLLDAQTTGKRDMRNGHPTPETTRS